MKKFLKEVEVLQDRIDVKKRFPNYFTYKTKVIMNIAAILILFLVGVNFYLDGGSFVSFSFSCQTQDGLPCRNPFYDCSKSTDNNFSNPLNIKQLSCEKVTIPPSLESRICANGVCEMEYLPNGFYIGRKDWLYTNSFRLMVGILVLAFISNHFVYLTWKGVKR